MNESRIIIPIKKEMTTWNGLRDLHADCQVTAIMCKVKVKVEVL